MNPALRILIVDDHVIIRRGLKFILETNFGIKDFIETDSCKGFQDITASQNITHVVLDMQLTDGNVIEVLSDQIAKHPNMRIMVYTMSPEELFGVRLLQMGVHGFLNKNMSEKEVMEALGIFLRGEKYISPFVQNQIEQERHRDKPLNPFQALSEREMVVMNYLLTGDGIKEISNRMGIKSSTVATFKARLFNKLGVSNVIDLKNLAEIYKFRKPAEEV